MSSSMLEPAPSFRLVGERSISSLNLQLARYEHVSTGAVHLHLGARQKENVFMVALRTVPGDSTGVAHILEHTALCGSKRYPVRDPFFMMLRRSLNTFMNAFTGSDWTAYPFATQSRKDFDNLLQVYLDAVFFPRLDPLDFAQEGHRMEYAQSEDQKAPALNYCGVVFNEMKGAMSAVSAQIWQALCAEMYPTSTYRHNSGGDPADIPNLGYEELVAFHRRYYHPSNAIFMSYGDIPANEHQARFEEKVLCHFERGDTDIVVPVEQRFAGPKSARAVYSARDSDIKDDAHNYLFLSWLLCDSTDFDTVVNTHLLEGVLLNHSASPLRWLLETTKLAKAPSSMTGLMDGHRELMLLCGVEGARADDAEEFERAVMDVIHGVANNGVDKAEAESVLHQYELQHREIGGDTYPYGLQLLLQCLPAMLYKGDVLAALDMNTVLRRLKKDIENPRFIPGQIEEQLVKNPHRLRLSVEPDTGLNERQVRAERTRLAEIGDALKPEERDNIVRLSTALQKRQQEQDNPDVLPRLRLSDVPSEVDAVTPLATPDSAVALSAYERPTNGLAYQRAIVAMPAFSEDQLRLLPLYTHCVTELGIGERDYMAVQREQAAVSGGVSCHGEIRAMPHDAGQSDAHIVFGARTLLSKVRAGNILLRDTLRNARFDEYDRLRELLANVRARVEENITQEGHQLAMTAACSLMSPVAYWTHEKSGLPSIERLKALDHSMSSRTALKRLGAQLADMHALVSKQTPQLLLVTEPAAMSGCIREINDVWQDYANRRGESSGLKLPTGHHGNSQLWRVQSQVNFCARAWKTVPYAHRDAPVLEVLAAMLRNGFLHREIRERGGAYGGGARQSNATASFVCYSYRDPRLEQTLSDFDSAMEWLQTHEHSEDQLEEAILSVVGGLDKPMAPAGAAIRDFHNRLYGYEHSLHLKYRQAVLETSIADVLAAGARYLKAEEAHTAVLTPHGAGDALLAQGYELHELGNDSAPVSNVA